MISEVLETTRSLEKLLTLRPAFHMKLCDFEKAFHRFEVSLLLH
jgi:hypothetical protein